MRRTFLRILTWIFGILGSLLLLIVTSAVALFFVARSPWGQQKILSLTLPKVQASLQGHLQVGSFDTDVLTWIELHDVILMDREDKVAVSLKKLRVNYTLWPLLHKVIHITSLILQDGFVHGRYLSSGELNLTNLLKSDPQPKASSPLPVKIKLDQIQVEFNVQAELAPPSESKEDQSSFIKESHEATSSISNSLLHHIQGHVLIAGQAYIADQQLEVNCHHMLIRTSDPAEVVMELQGEFSKISTKMVLHQAFFSLATRAEEVARWMPGIKIQGPLGLIVKSNGSLDELQIETTLTLPQGAIHEQGTVNIIDPELPWHLKIFTHNLDLLSLKPSFTTGEKSSVQNLIHPRFLMALPSSSLALEIEGQGEKLNGSIKIKHCLFEMLKSRLAFAGDLRFVEGVPNQGQLALAFSSGELQDLHLLGLPLLSGQLSAHVSAEKNPDFLSIDTEVNAHFLRMNKVSLGQLQLSAHTKNFIGNVHLGAKKLNAFNFALEKLILDAKGEPGALAVKLQAAGKDHTHLELQMDGAPLGGGRSDGKQPVLPMKLPSGFCLFLNKLEAKKSKEFLYLSKPVQILVESLSTPKITIAPLFIRSSFGDLRFQGQYQGQIPVSHSKITADIMIEKLNIQKALRLWTGKIPAPATQINVSAQIEGSLHRPDAKLQLEGISAEFNHIPKAEFLFSGQINAKKIAGAFTIRAFPKLSNPPLLSGPLFAGTMSEPLLKGPLRSAPAAHECRNLSAEICSFLQAKFEWPLEGKGPLHLEVESSVSLDPWQEFFPSPLKHLSGQIQVRGQLLGTKDHPDLSVQLVFPQLETEIVQSRDLVIVLDYHQEQFRFNIDSKRIATRRAMLGGLLFSLGANIPWNSYDTIASWKTKISQLPISAQLSLKKFQLDTLSRLFPPSFPVSAGIVSADLFWQGSLQHPTIQLGLQGQDLAVSSVPKVRADFALDFHYEQEMFHVEMGSKLNKLPCVFLKVESHFDLLQFVNQRANFWKQIPIRGSIVLLPFDIGTLSKAHGQVQALASLQGKLGDPRVKLRILGENLGIEDWNLGRMEAEAEYQGNSMIRALVSIVQPQEHKLRIDAQIPLPFQLQSTRFHLVANHFVFNYFPKIPPESGLRELQGEVNADMQLRGLSDEKVPLEGYFQLDHGIFSTTTDPQRYQNISMALRFVPPGDIYLDHLSAEAETGKITAFGQAKLQNLALQHANLDLQTRHFPISAGSFGFWVDTHIQASARVTKDVMNVDIQIPSGSIELPKLATRKNVQPMKELEEIHYVDQEEIQKENQRLVEKASVDKTEVSAPGRAKPPSIVLPKSIKGKLQLPSSFLVHGPELDASLEGHLNMELSDRSSPPELSGLVRVVLGHAEILDHRYTIERAQISLDGSVPMNPMLDILISRTLKNGTTIFLSITGTPQKPQIELRSDPPIYDQGQIISILLLGDPQDGQGGDVGLGNRALGLFSGLLASQLKERLAELLPIDVIKIETGGSEGLSNTRLEVGKYLLNNLYVGVSHQFGSLNLSQRPQNREEVRVEYQFLRNLDLPEKVKFLRNVEFDSRIGDMGVGAADLFIKWRF